MLHSRPLSFFRRNTPFSAFILSALLPGAGALLAGAVPLRADVAAAPPPALSIIVDSAPQNVQPPPRSRNGTVFVPLRALLETLGARVDYENASQRITVVAGGVTVLLQPGQLNAVAGTQLVTLAAAPQLVDGHVFVPLRSLAELFGFEVNWRAETGEVAIDTHPTGAHFYADHRKALAAGGPLGIEVDFTGCTPDEALALLDKVKLAGAGVVKMRFDWDSLEPSRGAAFAWPLYDAIVRGARERKLIVVGVLGNSAHWASQFKSSTDTLLWRNGPPQTALLPAWANYVRRVVGRYHGDVHAWQVWERTSSDKFRSGFKVYLQVFETAARAARQADPLAIIHSADPGGVDLNYIENFNRYVPGDLYNGISLYPTAGYRPGVPAAPESFLRPFAALRSRPAGHLRDLWVGGLSFPVVGEQPRPAVPAVRSAAAGNASVDSSGTATGGAASPVSPLVPAIYGVAPVAALTDSLPPAGLMGADERTARRLLATYTPAAQADYLARAATLALAAGSEKVFWGNLLDPQQFDAIEPLNPEYGSGLLHRDLSPRPAFQAFRTLAQMVGDKPYAGAVALGPDVVALLFDNGDDSCAIVWALVPGKSLVVNTEGVDPKVPDSIYLSVRPSTQVLDSQGQMLAGSLGTLPLSGRPLWISHISFKQVAAVKAAGPQQVTLAEKARQWGPEGVAAHFDATETAEQGLSWRPYRNYRSALQKIVTIDGMTGLQTEISTDIFHPADGRYFIFLDVADDYLYFAHGVPVQVTVQVHRTRASESALYSNEGGFTVEYSTAEGTSHTPWQTVESGKGWVTYSYTLPNAGFTNAGGFDLLINTFGSKQNLVFGSVTVKKLAMGTPAAEAVSGAPASAPGAAATEAGAAAVPDPVQPNPITPGTQATIAAPAAVTNQAAPVAPVTPANEAAAAAAP